MIVSIAICDEKIKEAQKLRSFIQKKLEEKRIRFRIERFVTAEELWEAFSGKEIYQLVFLSESICKYGTLKATEKMWKSREDIFFIFLINREGFEVTDFEAVPLWYLFRPIKQEKVEKSMDFFIKRYCSIPLAFDTPEGTFLISSAEILYFEIFDKTIVMHQVNGEMFSFRGKLYLLEKRLEPYGFLRCHRSFLVNEKHIRKITDKEVVLNGNTELPLGRTYREKIKIQIGENKEYMHNL